MHGVVVAKVVWNFLPIFMNQTANNVIIGESLRRVGLSSSLRQIKMDIRKGLHSYVVKINRYPFLPMRKTTLGLCMQKGGALLRIISKQSIGIIRLRTSENKMQLLH